MTSQVKLIGKQLQGEQSLPLAKRLLLVLFVCSIQAIYIPTSNRLYGGIEPKLPIDIFPAWAVWALPYLLVYAFWISAIAWALFKMDDRLFRSMVAAFLFTCTVSASIFIFFPTYVRAETFQAHDIFTALLRFIHQRGGRYDAFPSGHVYITTLLVLFYNLWYPRYKFYWVLIPVTVALSTLFTHQHYIVDVIGGLVVALLGYHFGRRWAGFSRLGNRPAKTRILQPPS